MMTRLVKVTSRFSTDE